MGLKIITDHKWHEFKERSEVPAAVLNNEFDHLEKDDALDNFIKYKNNWYHTSDFCCIEKNGGDYEFNKWDGYHGETAFGGVVIKVSGDEFFDQKYMIGRVLC